MKTSDKTSVTMPCGHAFHRKCVRAWFCRQALTCPMCRSTCVTGMTLLGPRMAPRIQALLRTFPPPLGCFFPGYLVDQLDNPEVAAALGDKAELLIDVACETFTQRAFLARLRALGV